MFRRRGEGRGGVVKRRRGREDTIQEATKKKWKNEEKSALMGKLYRASLFLEKEKS